MVLYQEPSGGAVPPFHRQEAEEARELVVGPACRQKEKVEIFEAELQKLVWRDLDGVRVFHTLYHHRVAPLAERT